jgi:hypothetical protein
LQNILLKNKISYSFTKFYIQLFRGRDRDRNRDKDRGARLSILLIELEDYISKFSI